LISTRSTSGAGSDLPPRLAELRRAVQRRAAWIHTLLLLPPVAAGLLIVYRYWGVRASSVCAVLTMVASAPWVRQAIRAYDAHWLVRRLNALLPAFEDSVDLLRGGKAADALRAGSLPALQIARLQNRLQELRLPDLRPAYPRRTLLIMWAGALLVAIGVLIAPWDWRELRSHVPAGKQTASSTSIDAELHVTPPAYTGLPARELTSLDANVPEGSSVAFAVHPGPGVTRAALVFHDGSRLELRRDGDTWRAERLFAAATLFRLSLDGAAAGVAAPAQPLHRLDVIPDRPPEVIVRTPERTLNLLASGQKTWDLAFEASDDYGLGLAQLSIAHAQGSGENIKSTQQSLVLEGKGDAHHRTYRKTLDLAALGFTEGDDLIVRLSVADNHSPQPNVTQSASFILRWPVQVEAASVGMEGLVQKTLPAYFASERQIIIDSEALQAERGNLQATRFAARADELGVEQKVLRLRYGEFLGEESEHSAQHDDDTSSISKAFGDAGNITSEYGHVHDRPEAATLLDPDTRRILKSALDEMWQAELHLRQAAPDEALPYEYKALDYVKQVQQAERIYLARAGVQLPQVDAGRRLTGDRTGLNDREFAASTTATDDPAILGIWQSLHGQGIADWSRLTAWIRQHQDTMPDALGLLAAADRVRRDPTCATCRADLANLLWPLLPQPGAALQPRREPDAAGAAYLRALAASAASATTAP
jgi:Domain of unknown function (DUF4175)